MYSGQQTLVYSLYCTLRLQYRQDLEANDAEKDGRKQKRMIHVGGKNESDTVMKYQYFRFLYYYYFSDNVLLLIPTVLNRYLNFLLSKQAVCLSYGQTS